MLNEREIIEVSDEVIAICALNATLRTEGVLSMYGGLSNALSRNFLGKDLLSKGIKVNQFETDITIDVHVIITYGFKIPAVAWEIQENVKKEVQTITENVVKAVNIHVEGVEIPEENQQ